MTICVSVKVRDGLVLTTDSMTQIQSTDATTGNVTVVKAYSNARKLFQIGSLPVGVMTFGLGNIGSRSIQSFILEFDGGNESSVRKLAGKLRSFIWKAYDKEFRSVPIDKRPVLGIFVAGYSGKAIFVDEWEFQLPNDAAPIPVRPATAFGSSWRGITLPFVRLYHGFDPRIYDRLIAAGVRKVVVEKALQGIQTDVIYGGMPVQDAVAFSEYLARTTIGFTTFESGTSTCGGPLQIATIVPDAGFEWISKPRLEMSYNES